jgi:hypothetical protein
MVYRRKYRKRTKRPYRKRAYRKRRRPRSNTGYLATRQVEVKTITLPPNQLETIHQEAFRISDLPQLSTFAKLFDQYRIAKVNVRIFPTTYTAPTDNNRLLFASSIDLDGGIISTFSDLMQIANTRLSPWCPDVTKSVKSITLVPRYRNNIIEDASDPLNVTYAQTIGNRKSWIDLADQGLTQHFGLNLGWLASSATGTLNEPQDIQFVTTYYIQFRKVR